MTLVRRPLLLAAAAIMGSMAATAAFSESTSTAKDTSSVSSPAKPAESSSKPIPDYTIIRFGKTAIKNSEVVATWKSLFPGSSAPDFNKFDENIRQNVLRGMISERLIYNAAQKAGFDKDPVVKKRLETMKKQVIMQSFMDDKAQKLVTTDKLKAAYDQKAATTKNENEVKARHILVATEKEANQLAQQVKNETSPEARVQKFEELAKEKSTDKSSGLRGGELGWFTKDKMVPEFADAAYKLKKGEISSAVKTPFGYHVIMVEDRRPITLPSFESMQETLKGEVANKLIQSYLENMLQNAQIKYYAPDGNERPFSTSLTPPLAGAGDN